MALDEKELMLRVRAGGPDGVEAFEELVQNVHPILISFFYRKSWNREEAHDRAQEVLVKVWNSRRGYEPRASFRTYLFQIARNHWIDVLRARRIRPQPISLDVPAGEDRSATLGDLQAGNAERPLELAEQSELHRRIQAAIATLSAGHREVWELAEGNGLKYAEISAVLGIPVGTVKSRHHHAIRKLRRQLLELGVDQTGFIEEQQSTRGSSTDPLN